MIIGKNIYELRKKRKLSQEEIAEKINVTRQTVSNWETSQTVPDLYQSKLLAKVLNVSIDELVKNIDDKQDNNLLTNESNLENTKNSNKLIDVSNTWSEIKLHLLDYISQISYDIWFEPIIDAKQNNTEFIIYSEEEIVVRHINEYYKDILIKVIQTHYSKDIKEVKIELIVKQLS